MQLYILLTTVMGRCLSHYANKDVLFCSVLFYNVNIDQNCRADVSMLSNLKKRNYIRRYVVKGTKLLKYMYIIQIM